MTFAKVPIDREPLTLDNLKLISYSDTACKKYGFWVTVRDDRRAEGRYAKRTFINFIESSIGPLGQNWHYQSYGQGKYLIKFNDQKDLLMFLLKCKRD